MDLERRARRNIRDDPYRLVEIGALWFVELFWFYFQIQMGSVFSSTYLYINVSMLVIGVGATFYLLFRDKSWKKEEEADLTVKLKQ